MNRLETVKELSLVRVVGDDLAHCSAMSFMLESKGWTVAAYNSAKEFLINDKPGQPGCLILDVNMPEMTGLELQEHLNQQGNTVPIIFLTSYGDIDMAVNALHSGAADFLQKPVKSEKLLASVEKAATASVTLAEPLRVMSQEEAKQKLSLITEREIQILKLTSLRLSSRAVGERLGISDRTVESHRASAGKKTPASHQGRNPSADRSGERYSWLKHSAMLFLKISFPSEDLLSR